METVRRLSKAIPGNVALIGFAGAPWTVATYMVAGQGTDDQGPARMLAYRDPVLFGQLIDMLVTATAEYLLDQVKSGIEIIQISDTWAGTLPEAEFGKWVVETTARLVTILRQKAPHIPIIGFARGWGKTWVLCPDNRG